MSYAMEYPIAARAVASDRAAFIRRTYGHLAGAILAFVGLETALLKIPGVESIVMPMFASWWLVLLGFMVVSWVARSWALSDTSLAMQYFGLGLYVVAQAVIFLPLLYFAAFYTKDPNIIPTAGILTLAVFGGLTAAVFITKRDFSFLRPILAVGCFLSLGMMVAMAFTDVSFLWLGFCFVMVGVASAAIIYQTSNVLREFRTDQHVAASLALFAAVALLFWYVIQIVMSSRR